MKTIIVTILTEGNSTGSPWRAQFEESCLRNGISYVTLPLKDYSPVNGDVKLKSLASLCISKRSEYTHVLFVDGFDSIFTDQLSAIESAFEKFGSPMVVSGCTVLQHRTVDDRWFPMSESGSPFRFPCPGVFMSEIGHFLRLVASFGICESTGPFRDSEWFQHVAASLPSAYKVDTDGHLFVTLGGSHSCAYSVSRGSVELSATKTFPLVVHSGPQFSFDKVLEDFGFEHVEKSDRCHPAVVRPKALQSTFKAGQFPSRRKWLEDYKSAWSSNSEFFPPGGPGDTDELDKFLSRIIPEDCSLILDFGSGDGRMTSRLAEKCKTVVSVDVNISQLKKLRSTFPSFRIEEIDGPSVSSVHENSVNFALAWDVLSYVDFYDLVAILRELNRVSSPGSCLVANFVDLKSKHNAGILNGVSPAYGPARVRAYTAETLEHLFSESGFDVQIQPYGDHHHVVVAKNTSKVCPKSSERLRTFYHSGDAGDIVYALLAVKIMGGGKVYLGADPHIKYDVKTRVKLSHDAFCNIAELVRSQPYVQGCSYADVYPEGEIDVNLNEFRIWLIDHQSGNYWNSPSFSSTMSLCRVHLKVFGIDNVDETIPWISASPIAVPGRPIVVARSKRYNNHRFPWKEISSCYRDKMFFVGTDDEYVVWKQKSEIFDDSVPHIKTKTLSEVASFIAGSKLFIGNQSCPGAIAEGLKIPLVQESWDHDPNCMFERQNALYQSESVDDIVRFVNKFLNQ